MLPRRVAHQSAFLDARLVELDDSQQHRDARAQVGPGEPIPHPQRLPVVLPTIRAVVLQELCRYMLYTHQYKSAKDGE